MKREIVECAKKDVLAKCIECNPQVGLSKRGKQQLQNWNVQVEDALYNC